MKSLTQKRPTLGVAFAALLTAAAGCTNSIEGGPDSPVDAGVLPDLSESADCEENAEITFSRSQTKPDVMLVVDRSGSMEQPTLGGSSKWSVMKSAISTIVVGTSELEFGLQVFPTRGECDVGEIQVPPGPEGRRATLEALAPLVPGGRTPTYNALQSVSRHFSSLSGAAANPDGQVVLLATDGTPSRQCGDGSDGSNTIAAVADLYVAGTKTYVLGFDFATESTNTAILEEMAIAGGTGQHFTADSAQELSQALEEIIEDVTSPSCTFELDNVPTNVDDMEIEIAGTAIEQSATSGWSYSAASNSVSLNGEACELLKDSGAGDVSVGLGCSVITVE